MLHIILRPQYTRQHFCLHYQATCLSNLFFIMCRIKLYSSSVYATCYLVLQATMLLSVWWPLRTITIVSLDFENNSHPHSTGSYFNWGKLEQAHIDDVNGILSVCARLTFTVIAIIHMMTCNNVKLKCEKMVDSHCRR